MLTAADDDFQVELTWDSMGNVLKDRQGYNAQGQEKWKAVTTTWSDAGSVQSILYPSTFAAAHTRDAIYRMTSLQDVGAGTNIATFTHQGVGRLATTSNQNGTSTDYTWDGFARIQDIDHKLGGGQTFHKFTYAYDKVHKRRMEQNTFDATWVGTLPQAVQTFLSARNTKGDVYAYDWAYRLTDVRYDTTSPLQEVQTPGSQAFVKNTQYVMDGLGNRSQTLTTPPTPPSTVTYASDVVNQYTQVGGVTRTHDNNGNLKDDGTYLFAYDFENRLVEVKLKATQAVIATYRYDALGRRVEKAVSGGATTRYVLDGPQVVEEYDAQDVWQGRYVYEDGIDRPRVMDRADQADVNGNQNTTEVLRFTYHQQALGSVTEISEPGGSVVEWVSYDVYGKPTILDQQGNVVSQSPVGNPYLFTGREYDAEDGLYFYRARAYDPGTGRFLQRDPLGLLFGPCAYEYSYGSPAKFKDPSGEVPPDNGMSDPYYNPDHPPGPPGMHYGYPPPEFWETVASGPLEQVIKDWIFDPTNPVDYALAIVPFNKLRGPLKKLLRCLRGGERAAAKAAAKVAEEAAAKAAKEAIEVAAKEAAAKAAEAVAAKEAAETAVKDAADGAAKGAASPAGTNGSKKPPKRSPNFHPPTNPPQPLPVDLPAGHHVREMPPTPDYPDGYWVQTNAEGQPVNPATGKPPANVSQAGSRAQTHVPLPPRGR